MSRSALGHTLIHCCAHAKCAYLRWPEQAHGSHSSLSSPAARHMRHSRVPMQHVRTPRWGRGLGRGRRRRSKGVVFFWHGGGTVYNVPQPANSADTSFTSTHTAPSTIFGGGSDQGDFSHRKYDASFTGVRACCSLMSSFFRVSYTLRTVFRHTVYRATNARQPASPDVQSKLHQPRRNASSSKGTGSMIMAMLPGVGCSVGDCCSFSTTSSDSWSASCSSNPPPSHVLSLLP